MESQLIVTDLVRNLRHQLRTPVNHIIGFSEMLQEEAVERSWDGLLPDLERIREVGRTLTEFISGTVDLAKVEAGKLDAAHISRDLRTPLESITGYSQLLQEVAEEQGWGDALPDLQKVEYAAKYLAGQIQAVLELATIYGQGSAPTSAGHAPAVHSSPRGSAGTVLIADDNDLDAEMLSRRLRQFGYVTVRATNGTDAIDLLGSVRTDVVLLDVLMPDLDGFETLRAVKASEALRDMPVIMISAFEEIPIVAGCVDMGADDFLVKPIDAVLLRSKVDAALERSRLRAGERQYMAAVNKVTAAAAALEGQTYRHGDVSDVAMREDSLGRLAQVFERMAQQLQAREESLQQQVSELRIEIDQTRLARDLASITGADYFQEVRRRGLAMRRMRQDEP